MSARKERGKQPLDPPPDAARLGAASGVEGPGRAQRQRREHDRPLNDGHQKEQHPSWIESTIEFRLQVLAFDRG